MIYGVDKENRLVYEVRPLGEFIMIRPAQVGLEHLIERITFVQFSKMFNPFIAKFLIPNQLDDSDHLDGGY